MKKKLISLALSAAMLFAGFSISAFAEEPLTGSEPEPAAAEAVDEEENSLFRKPAAEQKPGTTAGEAADETAEPEEEKQPLYVALGDSICAGVGLTSVQYAHNLMGVDVSYNFKGYPDACYVGQVAQTLGLDRDHAINLGLPGLMSADLVDLVKTGKMSEMNTLSGCQYDYPEILEYLKEADIRAAFQASMKKLKLTKSETDAVWNLVTSGMNKICTDAYPVSTANIRSVVETVRALNPDAQILLIGATNPVPLLPSWSNYFNKLNKFQKQLAEVYDIDYVAVPYAQTELDGHPTVSGHKYIAKKIVNAIQNG